MMAQYFRDFFSKYPTESFDRILGTAAFISSIMLLAIPSFISSWTMTLGELLTALIAGFAPVLIFTWGIRHERSKAKEQVRQEHLGIITVLLDAVTQLISEVEAQKENYLKLASAIQLDGPRGIPQPPFAITSHAHILEISYQSVLLAFEDIFFEGADLGVEGPRRESFVKLWKRIWFIKNNMEGFEQFVDTFIANSREYQGKFESTLTTINSTTGNFATSVQKMTIGSDAYNARFHGVDGDIFYEFIKALDNLNGSVQKEKLSPTKTNDSYLNPLLQIYNNPKFYEVHRNGELAVLILKAKNEYENLKNIYDSTKNSAKDYAEECDKIKKDFEDFVKIFGTAIVKLK